MNKGTTPDLITGLKAAPEKVAEPALLDHFAGEALRLPDVRFASLFSFRWASRIAYVHAAAMIKERNRILSKP